MKNRPHPLSLLLTFFSLHASGGSCSPIEAVCAASSPEPSLGAAQGWCTACPRLGHPLSPSVTSSRCQRSQGAPPKKRIRAQVPNLDKPQKP